MNRIIIICLLLVWNIFQASAGENRLNHYKSRYKVSCLNEKITDNSGNGFDELYGTRNMRTILYGIAYRGGANNHFHKTDKRHNHNPLPVDGLQHLANEGFSQAIYLYGTNFSTAPKQAISENKKDTLKYSQISGNSQKEIREILERVHKIIMNPDLGPIYLHCWNGWHQSGYVSSAILKQFCGFSDEKAMQYWMENTDGVNKGYENVKKKVLDFKPFEDLKIPMAIQKEICPCQSSKNK